VYAPWPGSKIIILSFKPFDSSFVYVILIDGGVFEEVIWTSGKFLDLFKTTVVTGNFEPLLGVVEIFIPASFSFKFVSGCGKALIFKVTESLWIDLVYFAWKDKISVYISLNSDSWLKIYFKNIRIKIDNFIIFIKIHSTIYNKWIYSKGINKISFVITGFKVKSFVLSPF